MSSTLRWSPVQVAALMDREDIASRAELAKRLPGALRSSIYRSLDVDWAGAVHVPLLIALAVTFNVPAGMLFCDPRGQR